MALWRSRDVAIYITSGTATKVSDFDTSGTDYAYVFKNVEFKEPERETGEQKLLGATSGNANSETWEEDPTTAELTGETLFSPKTGDTVDIAELFFTYSVDLDGNKSFNYAGDPNNVSFFIKFASSADNFTDFVGFIMNDTKLNTLGGVKVENDDHATSELKVTSSANDTIKIKGGTYAA